MAKFSLQGGLEFLLERPTGQRLWRQSHSIWGSFEEGLASLWHFYAMFSSLKLPWPMNGTDNLLSQKNSNLVLSLVLFESIHPGKCYSPNSQAHWEGTNVGLSGDLRAPTQPFLAPFKYLCTFSQNTMCTDNALTQCFESVSALNIWQANRQVH